jgi:hypothetical protein
MYYREINNNNNKEEEYYKVGETTLSHANKNMNMRPIK